MAAQWNENGNWLVTGSRDHLVKLYDIRMMKEMMTFRGHKKEVTCKYQLVITFLWVFDGWGLSIQMESWRDWEVRDSCLGIQSTESLLVGSYQS